MAYFKRAEFWHRTGYQRRKPEVGLLKAAYLSVFSLLGVEFAKAKALTNVRAQIQQPDADLYRNFCFAGEDVGREIYIMYTKETTCWAVAIDGYWVLLPSVDTDERSFPFDSLRNVLDMKKLAHVFPSRFTASVSHNPDLQPDAVREAPPLDARTGSPRPQRVIGHDPDGLPAARVTEAPRLIACRVDRG